MYVPGNFFKIDISHDDIDRFFIVLMIYKHVPCFFFKVSPPFFSNDRWYRLAKSFAFWKFGTQNQRHIGGGAGYIHSSTMLFMKLPQSYNLSDSTTMKHVFLSAKETFASYPLFSDFHGFLNRFLGIFFFFFLGTYISHLWSMYSDFFLVKKNLKCLLMMASLKGFVATQI